MFATLVLVAAAVPRRELTDERPHVDWGGAALSFLGLAGPTLALIRQPGSGWGAPDVLVPGLAGIAFLAPFSPASRATAHPMLPLELFKRRNFAAGNAQTLAMYAGLSILFFYLVLFLQQVAGYDALQAGFATLPTTIVMFALSKRAGMLADRIGPRLFMGLGPLLAAAGLLLLLRVGADVDYATELLPALVVFSIGLSATVAPLTATVLSDADEEHAGIASGVNNAIARAGGLLGVAALGAVIAAQFSGALRDRIDTTTLSPAGQAVVRTTEQRGSRARTCRRCRRARPRRCGGRPRRRRSTRSTSGWGSARRSSGSAACSASCSSATRAARSPARAARAVSSRARRSTPRASGRSQHRPGSPFGLHAEFWANGARLSTRSARGGPRLPAGRRCAAPRE